MFNVIETYKKYIKELFVLALPMILGNLGIILIGAGSVWVAAKHSTETLAAISIANSIGSCIFLFGIGMLASISPILSNFRGNRTGAKKYFLPTIEFAMILALVSTLAILGCIPLIEKAGFDPELIPVIKNYMFITAFSTFGGYLHAALKEFLQAFEIVFFPNFIAVFSVILNIYLSFVFVFGWYNLPAMGAVGLGLVSVLIRTFEGLCLLFFCFKFMKIKKYFDFRYFLNLIKIGLPIAAAILIEILAFNIITIVMGRVSSTYAASQNILLTISTATFMIPMAISTAIAVKVGFANGSKNYIDLKRYAVSGVAVSVGFMALCAIGFIIFPKFWVNIFTHDASLVKICVPILIVMGIFQIFDGLQVSLGGVFKGIKQTKTVMLGGIIAYWVLGLPLGFLLAFKLNLNLLGFWIGLAFALIALGIILSVILINEIKKIKA